MLMQTTNIFQKIKEKLPKELFEVLVKTENIRIERIISDGHHSPADFYYEQDNNEFVIVLQGEAVLEFLEENKTITLKTGDYINILSGVKHRVVSTTTKGKTVWLAIFY